MSLIGQRLKQSSFDSPAHEAMLSLLVTAGFLRDNHNEICQGHNISYQHFNILRILKGVHPNGHPRCEISERMVERSPDITRLIDKLVKDKLVKRTKSPADMRQSYTIITQTGLDLLNELNKITDNFAIRLGSSIGEENTKKIISICEKILMLE